MPPNREPRRKKHAGLVVLARFPAYQGLCLLIFDYLSRPGRGP